MNTSSKTEFEKYYLDHYAPKNRDQATGMDYLFNMMGNIMVASLLAIFTNQPITKALSNAMTGMSQQNMLNKPIHYSSYYLQPLDHSIQYSSLSDRYEITDTGIYFKNKNNQYTLPFTATMDDNLGAIVVRDVNNAVVFSTLEHNVYKRGFLELHSVANNTIKSVDYYRVDNKTAFNKNATFNTVTESGTTTQNNMSYKYDTVVSMDNKHELRLSSYGYLAVIRKGEPQEVVVNRIWDQATLNPGQYVLVLEQNGNLCVRTLRTRDQVTVWNSNSANLGVAPYRLVLNNAQVNILDSRGIVVWKSNKYTQTSIAGSTNSTSAALAAYNAANGFTSTTAAVNYLFSDCYNEINFNATSDIIASLVAQNQAYFSDTKKLSILADVTFNNDLTYIESTSENLKLLVLSDKNGEPVLTYKSTTSLQMTFNNTTGELKILGDGNTLLNSLILEGQTRLTGFSPYVVKAQNDALCIVDKLGHCVWSTDEANVFNYYYYATNNMTFTNIENEVYNINGMLSKDKSLCAIISNDDIVVLNTSTGLPVMDYSVSANNFQIIQDCLITKRNHDIVNSYINVKHIELSEAGILYGVSLNEHMSWSSISFKGTLYNNAVLPLHSVLYSPDKKFVLSVLPGIVEIVNLTTDVTTWKIKNTFDMYVEVSNNLFQVKKVSDRSTIYSRALPSSVIQLNNLGQITDENNNIITL